MEDRTSSVPHAAKDDSESQSRSTSAPITGFDEAVTKLRQARKQEVRSLPSEAMPYVEASSPPTVSSSATHSHGNGNGNGTTNPNPADLATLSSTLKKSWPRDTTSSAHHQQHMHPQTQKDQQKLQDELFARLHHATPQGPIPMPTASYGVPLEHSRGLGKTALKAILEPGTALPLPPHHSSANTSTNQTSFTQVRPPMPQYLHAHHQQPQPQQQQPLPQTQVPTETQYAFASPNPKDPNFAMPANAFHQLSSATPIYQPDVRSQVPLRGVPVHPNQHMPAFAFLPPDFSHLQQHQQQSQGLNTMLAAQFAMQNSGASHGHIMSGMPQLDAQGRQLTATATTLGSRSKRDREHSLRKLDKVPKQTRRHVNIKVEPSTGTLQPGAGMTSGGVPVSPGSPMLMTGGSLSGLVPPMGSPVLFGKQALMHSLPMLSGSFLGMPPAQGRPMQRMVGRGVKQRPDIAVNTRVYNKSKNHVSATPRRWTKEEDDLLRRAVKKHQEKNWKAISNDVPGRNHVQCLQRWRKALDPNVVKGHWTAEEDERLLMLVAENPKNWGHVARGIPGRTAKQCRERYHNHLDPSIKKGDWTEAEDTIIIERQQTLGNKWAEISKFLPGRTENSVKIRWKSIQRQSQGGYHSRRAKTVGTTATSSR